MHDIERRTFLGAAMLHLAGLAVSADQQAATGAVRVERAPIALPHRAKSPAPT